MLLLRGERVNAEMSLVGYHVKNLDKNNRHGRCAEWETGYVEALGLYYVQEMERRIRWSGWDGNIIV